MFEQLTPPPEDALHAVMGRFARDDRQHKIDLGVGVYREADGTSPIMRCVAEAQAQLLATEQTKSYQALAGDERFLTGMFELVFGDASADASRIAAIQSVGGTGAVRLAIELVANAARSARHPTRVFVGLPTWPNHLGICGQLGLECITYPYFDVATQTVSEEATFLALQQARAGDVFVLHGPCHNPTGADLERDVQKRLVDEAAARGVIPVIDAAYYGLGGGIGGDVDDDLAHLRELLERCPEAQLVLSCSKAFGLYRERTGVLFSAAENATGAKVVQGTLEFMARGNYSMPPAHGAGTVGTILADSSLSAAWREELAHMRVRIDSIRAELAAASNSLPALAALGGQAGIFSLLPLTPEQVGTLASDHAIYLPASGRINIAGFKSGDVPRFVEALQSIL